MSAARRALILAGGWAGHRPAEQVELARTLLEGYEVVVSDDLGTLRRELLDGFDLLLPIWSMGELSDAQETALVEAVERGLGLVAWHGAASAFRERRTYGWLLGGRFVAHPGGDHVRYTVRFEADPLCEGLADFDVVSEQYYLLIDPAVTVLASTPIAGAGAAWVAGVRMPVAWRRAWGAGRVFYCSLGHAPDLLRRPSLQELLKRAVAWASRRAA